MFSSLRARLWLSYAFLIVTALGVVAIVLILFLLREPLIYRQIAVRLKAAEGVLASQTQPADHLETVAQALSVRAVLYSANGAIIKDSDSSLAPIALPTRVFLPRAFSIARDTAGKVWLYSLTRLSDGTWLLVAAQRPKVAPLLAILTDDLSAPLLEGGLIALLLALVLAFVIARWIADPLERVIAAARSLPAQPAIPVSVGGPREVQELTQAFNAMAARVIATQASQRDFVANVSHELKTPLTSIQGFAQALMDGTADTPVARRQAAELIRSEAGRMHRMALDLLDLARLDAGTAQIRMSTVDMAALLQGVKDKFTPMAADAGVTLQMSVANDLPTLMGDGDRLAQVFSNLVDNALKFTARGGSVNISAVRNGDEIQVSVNDTGSGIPAVSIPHIFERFYRADSARAGGDKHGAGLGLAIAHEIVTAHGGRISVRSALGQGTGFVVHLPLKH